MGVYTEKVDVTNGSIPVSSSDIGQIWLLAVAVGTLDATIGVIEMKDSNSKASRALARMLDQATVRALDNNVERSPAEIIADFDYVQAAALSNRSLSAELQLETRRRVAERKISVLSERSLPYAHIESLVGDLRKLGYTNLAIEGRIEIIFARYCIREGHPDAAKAVVTNLLQKIPAVPARRETALCQQLHDLCTRLLGELS